jgi:type II secretory pathway predicted ATPase ExeA
MDINARFSITSNPFIKSTRNRKIIETNEMKEVITRLNYLKECLGIGLLTAEAGIGKTTAINYWSSSLNPSKYKVMYISLSTLTTREFYRKLAQELGCEVAHRKIDNYHNIQQAIRLLSNEKRITPVIILDEANYISSSTLNDLKMIFNFEMDSKEKAIVLMVGLPSINNTLNLRVHDPLRQRIVMNYHMDPLSIEDVKRYILDKLKSVDSSNEIFTEEALHAIASNSNGVIRVVDNLCNRCLLLADSQGKDFVNGEIVMMAFNDMQLV